jgi:hypothetical protein
MYKEKFSDDNYCLLKALHHTKIAMEYYEDVAKGYEKGAKDILTHYASKCKWIIDNVRHRLPTDVLLEIDREISDSLFLDSIEDKLIHFTTKQREEVEEIIDLMSKGQLIQINKTDEDEY